MQPITSIRGRAIPLDKADVDTDTIIPARHLKRVERTGYGSFAFEAWRQDPSFVLNNPVYRYAPILLAGPNFGCGSSREHAPWALQEIGLKAILAPSFGDIFRNNCTSIGLVTVILPQADIEYLMRNAEQFPHSELMVDLPSQTVILESREFVRSFTIDPFVKHRLLEGLDNITFTLMRADAIGAHEALRSDLFPKTISS
jgi:3-isopropylmalate/(R)-2-methylmalate dehydratase small subunit